MLSEEVALNKVKDNSFSFQTVLVEEPFKVADYSLFCGVGGGDVNVPVIVGVCFPSHILYHLI